MVHNGIEYGLMAAYAEGLNILRHANVGKQQHAADAETTPLRDPELYQYDFNLADIAEVWRRGSVIASWLLDLTAGALAGDPELAKFAGRVSDSGEGRWTVDAAIDEGVPAQVLTRGAVRALQLARRGRLRRQAAVGDALRVRRPRREAGASDDMGTRVSPARPTRWSFFGATGDLAYKKIFPALQAMVAARPSRMFR